MPDPNPKPLGPIQTSNPTARVAGLDSIRFVAAIWVVMSHGAAPLKPLFSDPVARLISGGFSSSFNGIAAVMVFFVVSGLCIHLPYVNAQSLPVMEFLLRRYIRIGLPLLAILLTIVVLGGKAYEAGDAVLWSVYAELVYYSMYPMFFLIARRFG